MYSGNRDNERDGGDAYSAHVDAYGSGPTAAAVSTTAGLTGGRRCQSQREGEVQMNELAPLLGHGRQEMPPPAYSATVLSPVAKTIEPVNMGNRQDFGSANGSKSMGDALYDREAAQKDCRPRWCWKWKSVLSSIGAT